MADQVDLPDNQESFKLNEVCKLANVQPYMLRFWGTEFSQLEAAKSGTGQRLYSRDQVQLILEIRRLLFDEGLTIAGARKRVNALQDEGTLPTPSKVELPDEPPAEPKKKAAASKGAKKKAAPAKDKKKPAAAAEADQPSSSEAQPLLATLKEVREEVAKIVAELKPKS
jgi:DNA-binding transcriptional MerR regulator